MTLPLADVLRDHWPDFVRCHPARLAAAHHRAARAVLDCRTPALGGHAWRCGCCRSVHYAYHSCNHRSCPRCGAIDQQKWAAVQEARLLPGVPYFLVTLTVPDSLRGICKLRPAILYDLLLREAAGALKDLCLSKLGGLPGFTAILHTWGRQMQHHPHVHLVVPGVVLESGGNGLRFPAKPAFLLHGRPLAARFRNRLELALHRDHPEIHATILRDHPRVFRVPWVADVRHTGSGRPALRYLARYVFKSALGPNRILGYEKDGRIRLLCHDSATGRPQVVRLSIDTFLSRWLVHVLPKGFVRVRHYGWMSGAARKTRLKVRALVCGQLDEPPPRLPEAPVPRCPHCGAAMTMIARIEPRGPPRPP